MASRSRKWLRLPRSLVGRSLLASVGALLLVMVLLGAGLAAVLALQTEPFSWEGPENQEAHLKEALRFAPDGRLQAITLDAGAAEAMDALRKDMAFQVLDDAGREAFTSPPGPALEVLRQTALQPTERKSRLKGDAVTLQVLASSFEHDGHRYTLRVARSERLSLGIRAHGSAIFYSGAVLMGLLAVLVFTGIALWTARRVVQPLREASEAAAAIQPGNLTQRVDSARLPSEVAPLVEAFNSALERLEHGYRVQQEFLAAAAHELKTPLALMRAEIELGNLANRELLLKDIDAMAVQVQQLLQLAEVSEIQNFQFGRIDVRQVIEETVAYVARFAESRHVHLRLAMDCASRPIEADAGALSTLVKNLIENAVHHSPVGAVVTVRLSRDFIAISDEGPGVAPHERPQLFKRFWRGENAAHAGAGLGLSICMQIATAHGWTLSYEDLLPQPGAEFRVTFGAA